VPLLCEQRVVCGETPLSKAKHRKEPKAKPEPAAIPHAAGNDTSVPAGDSPGLPRWPLVLAAVAWGAWLVFMIVMMLLRMTSSGA
jgi:hypothetical protein